MTLVSIIIPTYNRATVVGRAIESALKQTIRGQEVIVVDDGSRDDTRSVVAAWVRRSSRVRLLTHEVNRGAQAARNTGAAAASGGWLSFLDSDDMLLPESVERRVAEGEASKAAVVHGAGWVERDGVRSAAEVPALAGRVYEAVLRHPGPIYQGMLIRSEALAAIGGVDESILAYQEWETAIRLARRYSFAYVAEPTFVYDCSGSDNISKNHTRAAKGYEQILRKHYLPMVSRGPRVVADHHDRISKHYWIAGDLPNARWHQVRATLYWPSPSRLRSTWMALLAGRPAREPGCV